MQFPLVLRAIPFPSGSLELFVPDAAVVENSFRQLQDDEARQAIPFWAQLWPSAIAMAQFLEANPKLYRGRKVLELGAGLGLPALVTARLAATVVVSDIDPEAVAAIHKSIAHLGYTNIQAEVLDWGLVSNLPVTDLVVMSDVNYAPETFTRLMQTIQNLLVAGSTVLLGTPQRLMARDFINGLLPVCSRQETIEVWHQTKAVQISILQLDPPSRHIRL